MVVGRRTSSGIIQMIRKFLFQRDASEHVRYSNEVATRSPPPPCIPHGPHEKLSANHYYGRNARGDLKYPQILKLKLCLPEKQDPCGVSIPRAPTPGKIHHWDENDAFKIDCKPKYPVEALRKCGSWKSH